MISTIFRSALIVILLTGVSTEISAQRADTSVILKVSGNCEMCKERLEKGLKSKGIKHSEYDYYKKTLKVVYNPTLITLDKLHKKIAALGHDTEKEIAPEAAYEKLHDCCRYRENPENVQEEESSDTLTPPVGVHETIVINTARTIERVIKGTVYEAFASGEKPLAGATVRWKNSSTGVVTDSSGSFSIPVADGSHKLLISFVGYPLQEIDIHGETAVHVTFSKVKELSRVVVSSSRRATYVDMAEPVRMSVITQKELLKAACCNLSESFETNPSVDVSFNDAVTGSKQIHLLGLSGNYTQLTVENMPGPRGLATAYGLNSIPGTWVESIQLIKGAGTVINGFESIAGQINVELRKPQTSERLYANVYTNDWGKTDLNLNLSKKIGKNWSTSLLLHDAFANMSMDFNKDGFRDAPTGNLFTAMNRWAYDNGKNLESQFGFRILTDEKTAGDVHFNRKNKEHMQHGSAYGVAIDIDRWEAFAKLGYVFEDKKYQSVGLQVSTFTHKQQSYFGLREYNAHQQNFYANFIFQSAFGNTAHKYRTGLSFIHDKYDEVFNLQQFRRTEMVPGAFFEYTYSPNDNFALVTAMRADYNNLYGWFATPRLHLRYEPVKGTVIRASFGRGQRTANILAENNSVLVSSRQVVLAANTNSVAYGLQPEVAWNKGLSIDQKFKLFGKAAMLSFDYYRNDFQNQVVVDLENASSIRFYNLNGRSFSNSFQTELSIEPVNKLSVKLAYRFYDVKITYGTGLLEKPFTARHRTFANFAYEVKGWKFDYTVSHNGVKRIPNTSSKPAEYRMDSYSPAFVIMNAQVSKTFGKKTLFEVYVGGENLTNFFQKNLILAADKPYSEHFDAAMIWGPVGGRMFYAGMRFKLQ